MITKSDTLILLAELEQTGVDTSSWTLKAVKSPDVDIEVVGFINKQRPLDISDFYEKLRKSYNQKHSSLYKNIVKSDESDDPKDTLTTLAALNLQILLFAKNVSDRNMFLQHARFEEINKAMLRYATSKDIIPCMQVLRACKADLKAFAFLKENYI